MGLTTVFDEAGVEYPGAGFFDSKTDYVAYLELWREHKTTLRIRAQRTSFDSEQVRGEVEEFLNNAWWNFGDNMLKVTALGEHIVKFPSEGKISSVYESKLQAIAKSGWSHEQHSSSFAENQQHMAAIEKVHMNIP